jgi:hypothetical protein
MITVTRNMKEAGMTDLSGLETTPEVGDESSAPRARPRSSRISSTC